MERVDLVIIGGGPGGYVAAIKAAQLGLSVVVVEKGKRLGGTCLNVGCIPSKALLKSTHNYYEATNHFAEHGINFTGLDVNIEKMMARKDKVVNNLGKGIEFLLKKNKVKWMKGSAYLKSENEVVVIHNDGKEDVISTKNIIIATGSEVVNLPNVAIDDKYIVNSTDALSFNEVPESMLIVGAGVIGVELGSVWSRLGCKVTLVEYADKILPALDDDITKEAKKIYSSQGLEFILSTKVSKVNIDLENEQVEVDFDPREGGDSYKKTYSKVMICIGRKACTTDLGLDCVKVDLDDRGRIKVNDHCQTNIDNIYAIGDVNDNGVMLAHKAEEEAIAVVESIVGQSGHIDYNLIPSVVYTSPEIACIGQTEQQLKQDNIKYNVGKFPFSANSRACATGETDGFVKILSCAETDTILGVHIICSCAGTLIGELAAFMAYEASSEDVARVCHSHPDMNEAVKEAAMDAYDKAIHK